MLGDPRTIEPGIDLILMSRHLERVGDHATNIAEDVIFIVEARDVRHHSADRAFAETKEVRKSGSAVRRVEEGGASLHRLCDFLASSLPGILTSPTSSRR